MPGRSSCRILLILVLATSLLVAPLASALAQGQGRVSLIRDAEIEATLQRFSRPILEAAGLGSDSVRLYIVKDDRLNAFVAGGMNLFLNTGLLMRTEHPGQLIGVIAHEVGHIAGGHLSRVGTAQKRAAAEAILAAVLGAAAAVVGAPELGTAIISGGQSYAQSGLLRFSRSQEQAADQAAVTYLARAGLSPRGLGEFLKILESKNALAFSSMGPYLQTHPLTRDRISFVDHQITGAAGGPVDGVPPEWEDAHARMVAKLQAFLDEPRRVLTTYEGDQSLYGRYARAIALYRLPDLQRALAETEALIEEYPEDPYFHELKGQMLFENGRIEAAIEPYRQAVRLQPDSGLLRVGLGQALIETGAEDAYREAMAQLEEALNLEPTNATAWRLLGIARGRTGREGESALALAEYALLVGKQDDARLYARRAEERIDPSDPAWLRLQDILRVIEES